MGELFAEPAVEDFLPDARRGRLIELRTVMLVDMEQAPAMRPWHRSDHAVRPGLEHGLRDAGRQRGTRYDNAQLHGTRAGLGMLAGQLGEVGTVVLDARQQLAGE